MLTFCTLTGVDENTDFNQLVHLATQFPFAEWGFLYSPTRQGQGRYPAYEFLCKMFDQLPHTVHVALHICGEGVMNMLNHRQPENLLKQMICRRNGRLQLNFNLEKQPISITALSHFIHQADSVIITQMTIANAPLVGRILAHNHGVLFDDSAGQGRLRETWPSPLPDTQCGYAGGLGPDNLATLLPRIHHAANGNPYWIDMEQNLRNEHDQFSLWHAQLCLQTVQQFEDISITHPVKSGTTAGIDLVLT